MKWNQMIERLHTLGKDRFILLFLAGVMLVVIALPTDGKISEGQEADMQAADKKTESVSETAGACGTEELEQYRQRICGQLKQFLETVDGVGKAEVYITMHSTSEMIVERNSPYTRRSEEELQDGNTRISSETENDSEVVLVQQQEGGQAPIVVKELVPVVRGVVVAAQGADNVRVKKDITELVMALFGIEEHKIRVVKLNT